MSESFVFLGGIKTKNLENRVYNRTDQVPGQTAPTLLPKQTKGEATASFLQFHSNPLSKFHFFVTIPSLKEKLP